MSLVDYASSSDDEKIEEREEEQQECQARGSTSQPSNSNQTGSLDCQQLEATENSSVGPVTALPDALELLGSLEGPVNQTGDDHSSRVAAAMAASASRKRPQANGSGGSMPYRKLSRQNLPPSRIPPDTSGGVLIPPQLRGRSNVVTEDIDKLFVRRKRTEDHGDAASVMT